jgi:hypothetical protein
VRSGCDSSTALSAVWMLELALWIGTFFSGAVDLRGVGEWAENSPPWGSDGVPRLPLSLPLSGVIQPYQL